MVWPISGGRKLYLPPRIGAVGVPWQVSNKRIVKV